MEFAFRELLQNGAKHLGIDLSVEDQEQLELYFKQLKKWQKKVNLIAKATTDQQVVENHFLDSLTLLSCLEPSGAHLLDIGTGAGFPGLVCRAVCPGLQVSLVEPRLKRVSFLKHIQRTLGLRGVTIHADRLENIKGLSDDQTITHITCRAVTDIGAFLQMVEGFSGTGARVVLMKGPRWREEFASAQQIINCSLFALGEVVERTLPFSGAKRYILFFDVPQS